MENTSEEENLSSEDELEGDLDSDESWNPALFPTSSSELSSGEELETVTVAILSMEDLCLYCNQLIDKGNSEVFTMVSQYWPFCPEGLSSPPIPNCSMLTQLVQ